MPDRRSNPKDVETAKAMVVGASETPVPGAAAALPARLHGRFATATVGSITLTLFDWEVTFEMETFDATAHGEFWKVMVQGDQSWRARARGYFKASNSSYLAGAANTGADPAAVTFTGYKDVTPSAKVFEGSGFITRANFTAPMAMVEQELEIVGTGAPTTIA